MTKKKTIINEAAEKVAKKKIMDWKYLLIHDFLLLFI